MIRTIALVAALTTAFPALSAAQSAQPYSAPDKDLWEIMARALDDLPMSASAHQQVQNILAGVQREARIRERTAAPKKDDLPAAQN